MAQIQVHPAARRFSSFARLAASNLLAHASEQISLVAIPLVAVTLFDAGGGFTSVMQMLTTLPFLLFAIPFGLLIDRGSARGIMLAGELIRAVRVPLPTASLTAFHKIAKRRFDDISSVAVAFALDLGADDDGAPVG